MSEATKDFFKLHSQIMEQFKAFSQSFVDIEDPQILKELEKYDNDKSMWTEPLIQFNPSYQEGSAFSDLISEGLTNLYNLYYQENLDIKAVIKTAKCSEEDAAWGINEIQIMHSIQVECGMAGASAYGWNDIILNHGFYDLEFLPENDRHRYTACREVRKEIMSRLLKLNNTCHQQEIGAASLTRMESL